MKAYRKLRWCRDGTAFRPWLLAIVANETSNVHRSRRRREGLVLRAATSVDPPVTGPDDPAAAALAAERRAALVGALSALDERDRDVLVCRFLLDLSEAEAAADPDAAGPPASSRCTTGVGTVRLDEFDGELEPYFAKTIGVAGVVRAEVRGQPAVWIPEPHPVIYIDRQGNRHSETARLAGATLIWQDATVPYRLEGELNAEEALTIARSIG